MIGRQIINIKKISGILISLYLIIHIIENSTVIYVFNVDFLLGLVKWVYRIGIFSIGFLQNKRTTIFKLTGIILFFVVSIGSYLNTGYMAMFDMFLPIGLNIKINYNKENKLFKRTLIFGVMLIACLSLISIIPSSDVLRDNGNIRRSLGFSHPNVLGQFVLLICILDLNEKHNSHSKKLYIFWAITTIVLLLISDSTTSVLIMTALILCCVFRQYGDTLLFNKYFRKSILLICCLAISILIYLAVTGEGYSFFYDWSRTFAGRFLYANTALQTYGVKMFGQPISFGNTVGSLFSNSAVIYNNVDMLYIRVLIVYGIIPSLYLILVYVYSFRFNIKSRNFVMVCTFILMLFFSISESGLITFRFSIMFILALCTVQTYRADLTESSSTNLKQISIKIRRLIL